MSLDVSTDLEVGAEVLDAARAFAAALRETPAVKAFEQAAMALQNDVVARCAIDAYARSSRQSCIPLS